MLQLQAAQQLLQRAEAALQRYHQAHPIKAALGFDDGRGRTLDDAQDTYAQTERAAAQALQAAQQTRDAPATQREAVQVMDSHNAAIEAARAEAQTLQTELARQATTRRADRAVRDVQQVIERTQERDRDRGRDWGMER